MDSAHTLRDFTLSISPQWDVSAFTEEQNKETRRYYSTYRTDEKETKRVKNSFHQKNKIVDSIN
jgi:hypothetical protein